MTMPESTNSSAGNQILMVTPYLPYPPISGGRSRTYNLVKILSREYKITLVCFGRPEEKSFDLGPLRDLCELTIIDRATSPNALQAGLMSITSPKAITLQLYASPQMREAISELFSRNLYDLIHVESFYMMQNLPANHFLPVLLSEPAIEYIAWWRHAMVATPAYQRPLLALEAFKMRRQEPKVWEKASLVGAMSAVDLEIIKRGAPNVKATITPNGVDIDYFRPGTIQRDVASAVFMGDYKYFPNTDAVRFFMAEIMPLIRQKRPDFTLTLLGKEPPTEFLEMAKKPDSGLRVEGLVDDTRPYLHKTTMFICPLRSGSGTRFKLLEAMACGTPVISTSLGAEGLGNELDRYLTLADDPENFAQAVLKVIDRPEESARIARNTRLWVADQHSWTRSAMLLGAVYQKLIGSEDITLPTPANRRQGQR
jgi:polysaccharide biosynthesis protein PslH